LFKAARMRHPGRMRRYIHVAGMLREREVPHPELRWYDMDKSTLSVPYLIQDFLRGQDLGSVGSELSFTDQHRIGAKLALAFRALEPYGPDLRARAELYDLYVPLAGIASFRENDRPDREEAARAALRAWLERDA